ncbi:MAG TPA: hypothetical protein VND20_11060 [Candidatus Binataceae bacterium]|nr:hypothetical protein [Candidatus Binataceae bacterium]
MATQESQKSGVSLTTLLLVIFATLGIGAPLMRSAPTATPSPSAGQPPPVPANVEHSALDLIEEFYDNDNDQLDPALPWSTASASWPSSADSWGDDPRSHDRVDFVIATLPDPAYAALRYQFDGYLDAIEQALGAQEYELDRFDLPWLPSNGDKSYIAPAAASTDSKAFSRPGVMLFRQTHLDERDKTAGERLLIVFVVGETPTAGVDPPAMRSALDQVAWLKGWSTECRPAPPWVRQLTGKSGDLKILGPVFSGSATSLQEILRTWRKTPGGAGPSAIHLRSGTASAIAEWPKDLGDFLTMQIPDRSVFAAIREYFKNILHERHIAILSENTPYGRSYHDKPGVDPRIVESGFKVLWLNFPLHISDLRTAYSNVAAGNPTVATAPSLTPRNLPLSPESGASATDVVPSFAESSAADDELMLANVLDAIRREHLRYVGIVASDVEDTLFLVHQIRQHCPDTIPFLTSADLLYLHSDYNRDLAGTLVFSTYSMFSMGQEWTAPISKGGRRLQFANGSDEGVYNAVLALFNDEQDMLEYGAPFQVAPVRPPLWLSLVGNDGLWPIRYAAIVPAPAIFYTRAKNPDDSNRAPIDLRPSLYPQSFIIAFLAISLICLIPNLMMLRRYRLGEPVFGWFHGLLDRHAVTGPRWIAMLLEDAVDPSGVLERRLCLLSLNLVLVSAYVLATAVALLPLHTVFGFSRRQAVFGGVLSAPRVATLVVAGLYILAVGVITLLGTVVLCARAIREWRQSGNHASWVVWLRVASCAIGAGLSIWYALSIWREDPITTIFYFVRAADLGNAASPLKPLLFLGVATLLLSICELMRLSLIEECVMPDLFGQFDDHSSFAGARRYEQRAVAMLQCAAERLPNQALWLALPWLVFLFFHFLPDDIRTIDGTAFGAFFTLVAVLAYTAFLLLFVRFVFVWIDLRRLLQRLYFHPTRGAYEKLRVASVPPTLADRQRIRLFESSSSLVAIEFCLERARQLIRELPPPAAGSPSAAPTAGHTLTTRVAAERNALAGLVVEAEYALNGLLACQAAGERSAAIAGKHALQGAMTALAGKIFDVFEPYWRMLGQTPLAAQAPDNPDAQVIAVAELFVASRTVDFLRQIYPQLRNLVVFAGAGLLAMMLAATTYPFPRHDTIAWVSWTVLLTIMAVIFMVFVQMNRNRVISMLSGSAPGELNWNSSFVLQVVTFGVVPILTLLGAQFPYALQNVFGWVGAIFSGAH